MYRNPNLGQNPQQVDARTMLDEMTGLMAARILTKIKDDPTITGFIKFETLEIGYHHASAYMPIGPSCTFNTVDDALGIPMHISGSALTNPGWATEYFVWAPRDTGEIDLWIADYSAKGWSELPALWVGRRKDNPITIDDRFAFYPTQSRLVVITIGDEANNFLVCPGEHYHTETESDAASEEYGYRKGHSKWFWHNLSQLFVRGYVTVEDKQGIPWCRLVEKKSEETWGK